jgi:hypothetical protein
VHQKQHNIVLQQLQSIVDSQDWYCYAKTVIPVVVVGELLQPRVNTSTLHKLKCLAGQAKEYVNESHAYVHVKHAAEAGARQGARGARRRWAAVRMRRAHPAPRRALPHPRRTRYGDCQLPRSPLLAYSQV